MLHGLLQVWFGWVRDGGYLGVIALMAMESSIFPVPSEVVIPPAAFWAAQGRMSFSGVVLAGTFGSWLGSAISYWVSRWIGRVVILRLGRLVFIKPDGLDRAERFVERYEVGGVFFARLIKSAVSRQREYLADASSVQFTRNPPGLAGALKKIGGFAAGSRILNSHAEEASHLFFCEGVHGSFLDLLATHPPLVERIRRIDPTFDGNFAGAVASPEPSFPAAALATPPASPTPVARLVAPGPREGETKTWSRNISSLACSTRSSCI